MKYFSTFSGIGGFELGIGEMGESVGYSEIDKYAIKVYQHHFPNHKNYGDITKINAKELPDFDLLVGGFPCQAFSVAGKRAGFNDTRGTLFFDLARILQAKQPRLFVFENVKGLLSHDNGNTFKTIISTLDQLGYDLQWQVLNSKDFGVPQNRERVFIIGHLRGTTRPQVFPVRECGDQNLRQIISGKQGERVYSPSGISATISSQGGGLGAKTGLYLSHINRRLGEYRLKLTETSGTLTSSMWKGIDASGRTGVFDVPHIRRLTPLECERLQGFPDNWTEGVSDTQRYKCCGNAVTVNVVEYIMSKLETPNPREEENA